MKNNINSETSSQKRFNQLSEEQLMKSEDISTIHTYKGIRTKM